MNWRSSLSDDDVKEMYADACAAYQSGEISEKEFIETLAKLGNNATEIADAEKFYRPLEADGEAD